MIKPIVCSILLLGWGMQLWFGVAVVGVPPNHELVFREKAPLKYSLVMFIELLIGLVIGWYEVQAGMN
jgi:hypothetical protein